MNLTSDIPQPPSATSSGSYVEEREITQRLLGSRPAQEGHDVFVVRDEATDELLLIRSLAIDASATAEAKDAVVTAARQAVEYRHAAVLPVLNVEGTAQNLILMQSFPGGTLLADFLAQEGPMSPAHALAAMRNFVDALLRAQAMGLTISQISPQDFVVQRVGAGGGNTVPTMVCLCPPVPQGWWLEVSDPAFASPEQKRDQTCDVRSSLYSAGALLAHMLTGRQPDSGESWPAWLAHQELAPALRAALVAVLQENPQRRSSDPAAWLQLLDRAEDRITREPVKAAPTQAPVSQPMISTGAQSATAPRAPSFLMAPVSSVAEPASKSRLLVGTVVLVALGGLGFVVMRQSRQQAERAVVAEKTPPEIPTSLPAPASDIPTPAATLSPPPTTPVVMDKAASEPVPTAALAPAADPPAVPEKLPLEPEPSALIAPPPAPPVAEKIPGPPVPVPAAPPEVPPSVPIPATAAPVPPVVLEGPVSKPPPAPVAAPPAQSVPAQAVVATPAPVATPEELLLSEARQAAPAQRAQLYRKLLNTAPNHPEALREVVEASLADFPAGESQLQELERWTSALEKAGDPLGDYAHGRLLLEQAKKSANLRTASKSLATAVNHLGKAADRGYSRAWFLLLQGLVNLHNVQQQAGEARASAQAERTLFAKIDALPASVPVADTQMLAERLEQLVAERQAGGTPHPQAGFLKRVVQRLHAVVYQRRDAVSLAP